MGIKSKFQASIFWVQSATLSEQTENSLGRILFYFLKKQQQQQQQQLLGGGRGQGMRQFLGQELNSSHSSDNTVSSTTRPPRNSLKMTSYVYEINICLLKKIEEVQKHLRKIRENHWGFYHQVKFPSSLFLYRCKHIHICIHRIPIRVLGKEQKKIPSLDFEDD